MGARRKKAEDPPAGLPGWMATFSDLVTLLLTFFVLLMAMANFEDTQRVEAVFHSIKSALGVGGFDNNRVGAHNDPLNLTSELRQEQTIQPLIVKLREAMSNHVSDDLVRMTQNEQEVRIRLDDRVLFRPGSTTLHPAAYALLTDVAEVLVDQDVEIRIEAHTDADGDEKKNWQLSADRGLAVVHAFRERGPIPGERLEADAFGEFRPATTFGEDAAWNRRVELVLRSDSYGANAAVEDLLSP